MVKAQQFTDYALQNYGTRCKNACWIGDHLDTHTAQKVATRAFQAAQRYSYRISGRPRFKPKWKALGSVEAKSNVTGIRWRDGRVQWSGLDLAACFASKTEDSNADKDKDGYEKSALARRVKYCRIVRRQLRGRTRWYTQLILEGRPPWKDRHPVGRGQTVGLDIGPSTIAAVGEDGAFLDRFCPGAARDQKAIRRIQRAMDRSRRASNPGHYNPDGTIKQSQPRHWVVSQGYVRLRNRLRELQRRQAATRRREHGQLCHRVLAMGETVRAEKLSYKAFQRMFGKSVRDRGPGLFMDELRRKAESAGGQLDEFPTRSTKLSQSCHCGAVVKKPLRQRWHVCTCGVTAQRDLYSAYLGRHVRENAGAWSLDTESARECWCAAEPLLGDAVSGALQAAKGGRVPASFGISRRYPRQSGSSPKSGWDSARARMV